MTKAPQCGMEAKALTCSQPRSAIHSGNPLIPPGLSVHVCKVKKPFSVCACVSFSRQLARRVPGLSAQPPPRKTIPSDT